MMPSSNLLERDIKSRSCVVRTVVAMVKINRKEDGKTSSKAFSVIKLEVLVKFSVD